jgi:hypothetical protein
MPELPITVCKVTTPEGPQEYVALGTAEQIFTRGLPAEGIVGVLTRPLEPGEAITPAVFARHRAFVDFMHAVIAQHAPPQAGCIAEARRLGNGWVYIIDQRTPTPQGPVPPQDIVGCFEVKDGQVVTGSYRPNDKHRILSADGFCQLGAELQQCLLEELAKRSVSGS